MKNIWVFYGIVYYAQGGLQNLGGMFDTLEQAVEFIQKLAEMQHRREPIAEWYQIVDVSNNTILRHYGGGGYGSVEKWPEGFEVAPEDEGEAILCT